MLCELLKLPLDQLLSFQTFFCQLGPQSLLRMTRLLAMEPASLLELKRELQMDVWQPNTAAAAVMTAEQHAAFPYQHEQLRVAFAETTGFSPPTSIPTHLAGPMKTSIGSLDLGAIPMDMVLGDDVGELFSAPNLHRSDSDPLSSLQFPPALRSSNSDPFNLRAGSNSPSPPPTGASTSGGGEQPSGYVINRSNVSDPLRLRFERPAAGKTPNATAATAVAVAFAGSAGGGGGGGGGGEDGGDGTEPSAAMDEDGDDSGEDAMPPSAFMSAADDYDGGETYATRSRTL